MSISQRLRFKIFERDGFTCQYCGKKPPDVVLEADHVISRYDGGQDDEFNLLTSCFACNRGKGKKSVVRGKQVLKKELDALKEQKDQLEAYYNFIKLKEDYEASKLDIFQQEWDKYAEDTNHLTEYGLKNLRRLTEQYSAEQIL